jgi:putative nucleotidyltransferase-like protein
MTKQPRLPPLADTLSLMLPDAQDTLLLRACLSDAAGAAEAWQAWLATTPGLPAVLVERPRSRRFLPLLFHVLSTHGVAVAEPSLSILRAATLWEERRAFQIRPILVQVLAILRGVGASALLLKGVALAESAYTQSRLRHCHDLDLLVEAESLPAAREALLAAGYRPVVLAGTGRGQDGASLALQHEGGLPVNLHTKLWAAGTPDGTLAAFRRRARTIDIEGESVPIFAPMDMLLYVCGHAGIGAGPGNWTWIVDAAMILRRHPPGAEDWAGLVRTAAESGIAVALAVRFSELAARFDLAIPVGVLDALVEAAWQSSSGEKDAAISAARAASGVPLAAIVRQSGWRSRFEIARWALRRSRRLVRAWQG